MIASLLAGLVAGLLSSPHCLGMCGPLAAYAAMPAEGARPSPSRPLRWQLGRALAYSLLGALAGAIGAQALRALAPSWASAALSIALGVALAVTAARLWRSPGEVVRPRLLSLRTSRPRPPLVSRLLARAPRDPLALGLLTALLPCGALWSGVIIAAGSGSALGGALAMLGFASASGIVLAIAGAIGARGLGGAPLHARRLVATVLAVGALITVLRPLPSLREGADVSVSCHDVR